MVDDDFYNIARKMVATVSTGEGKEKIISKAFWNRIGVFRVADKKIYYPTSVELRPAFQGLIDNKIIKFRDCGKGNLGITVTGENKFRSTFSLNLKPV